MSDEAERTCPLCAEEMDLTDQHLKPCKCGYEICVWCWHHIMDMAEKDDTEGRCPACRSPYDKEKIVGMAANCERLVSEINMERKKSQKAKTKTSEGRKQLSSVRVIQRNLVYIVGLPLNLADEDLLHRREYFGQYGKVLKVSMSRTAAGVIQQFPNNTCSVYITYSKEEDAIRCIQSVHGFLLDGRPLKACFGTTKYCHAWLRNVPCTNPDCLYLHEIGSQEDSYTKDEIISAYTRVQQITGATNNVLRRAGSMLPPPLDDYCINYSASAPKPIVKSASTIATSTCKGSPPNGSSGKSGALPAAASWGMRSSSQPQVANSAYSNGPSKPKPEPVDSTIPLSTAVGSTTQVSTVHSDIGKKVNEDSQHINGKVKPDVLKPEKLNSGTNFRPINQDKPDTSDSTSAASGDQPPSSFEPLHEWSENATSDSTNSYVHCKSSSDFEKEVIFEGNIGDICSGVSSMKVNGDCESESESEHRASSSHSDHCMVKYPRRNGSHHVFAEQYGEPRGENSMFVNGACASGEQLDWRSEPETRAIANTVSEIEDDVISFANQRLKDPEVVSHNSYLSGSANSFHIPNYSRSHSFQQNESFGAVNLNADSLFVDNRVFDRPHLHASSNSVIPNGYPDSSIGHHASSVNNLENSYLLPNEVERKQMGRLQVDTGNATMDGGESSIISNILSLDLDSWDDPLTSPQHFAKLLGDNDKMCSSVKMSASWKAQNNNQSRFSFARQEESRNHPFHVDNSFNPFGQSPRQQSFNRDILEKRSSLLDKLGIGNGFSSTSIEEPESFANNPLVSSIKPPVSMAQFSVPPGFSVANRAPPPGFSSQERMDQPFDSVSGNHLLDSSSLRNSYLTAQNGNISSTEDIEFMDPAILAVGKGNNISRLQSGLSSPGLDMRANFQQQLNAFENEARLQLLMQRSLSSHQNLRYPGIGDNFSSLHDSYGISSRLMDQSQVNLSPFAQISHQQPRSGLVSNGHWDGWSVAQGGNSLGAVELLRNESLGFNKVYGAGYEDSKFRVPNSGRLYNRTFEM